MKGGFISIFNEYDNFFKVGQKNQKEKAEKYVSGLFCTERGKRNIERMVEEVAGSEYESLQHFISNSPWDTQGLMKQLSQSVSKELQGHGLIGCTVDEKAHLKKGTKSIGVSRQYAGTSGKVDNCQVGVYLSLCAGKYASITNYKLYLPKEWAENKERCAKAGIPEEQVVFKTKPELGLEMVKEHIENGVHFDFINGDGLYGNGYTFSKGVDALGKKYVLDVHSNQQLYLQKPVIKIPEPQEGKRGRKPTLPKPDVQGISVAEYEKTLRKSDYREIRIRPTTRGWLTALIHVINIWVWDEQGGDLEATQQTLVIRKPVHKKDKMKYALSNISIEEQSIEEFAFMQAQRFWIERCFRDDSHDLGMSDYQVRTYKGFNNHMALTCVAMQYVQRERMKNAKELPLLSYNDVRILLAKDIKERADYDCQEIRIEQLSKRHKQRAKDIMRYYQTDLPK
jgi:SRSO17 transposase